MGDKKNILVAQSGGPTAVINAALAGVIAGGINNNIEVWGGIHGIRGILDDNIINLSDRFENNSENLERLKLTPDMYLRSCRYKMKDPAEDTSDCDRILEIFEKYNIGYFLYIGGNDSMDTVAKVSEYVKKKGKDVKVVGVPKTVDNDLLLIDHTPGFGSAAKYVATTVREIMLDTCLYPMENVAVVEIMGRDAGWLTASAALAAFEDSSSRPLIYLPELTFDKDKFLNDIREELAKNGYAVVAVSEGIKDKDGNYISASESNKDSFGHAALSGTGQALTALIKNEIGCKVRNVDLATAQRSAGHIASLTDLNESYNLGERAIDYAIEGRTGVMSSLKRIGDGPDYSVEYTSEDVTLIANKAKSVPEDWIDESFAFVTEEMINYLKPLIIGETPVKYKDGLPDYLFEEF